MFDLLTYEKGCSVLRMLEQHIGADVFRDGVRTYLKAHAYGNTVTTDLWDALEDASGAPVRGMMNTFILQGGHPLVSLHGTTATQEPFSFGPPPAGTVSSIGSEWQVPLAVRALPAGGKPGAPIRHVVLGPDPTPVEEAEQGLAVLNAGGWGVFRVGYETAHRLELAQHLGELSPLERANLLADTWATTLAGRTTLREFLLLTPRLGLEPDPAPWAPVAGALVLTNRIARPEDRDALHEAVAALIGPIHRHLGFDASTEESERTPSLRALAINLMGTIGADEEVRAAAARRFDASPIASGSGEPIPADIETAVLAVVAQLVRPGDYDALLERYRSASTPQEEMRSLGVLASFPDVELCLRTFDLALTEVRSQNGSAVIGALLANPVGNQAVWERVTQNWDTMLDRFPKNAPPRILETLPALCADADFAQRAIAFLREHPLMSGPRRVDQSVERLRVNVAFAARRACRAGRLAAGGHHAHRLMVRASGAAGEAERLQALFEMARCTRGFMPDDEGAALYRAALRAGQSEIPAALPATFVEIGSWCGKSTVYLGAAAEATGAVVLSIDHHRGSEENQPGWEYHEPDLVDPDAGRIDTLLHWRRTITAAGLESSVVGVVGDSPTVAARWDRPLSFCFIDGGHGEEPAWADFRGWAPHVAVGGWLAIHDVFPDPAQGGRPPYELYRAVLESAEFVDDGACGSLRVLRRVAPPGR